LVHFSLVAHVSSTHLLTFFLYPHAHPRSLHSFPTRRSSDLFRQHAGADHRHPAVQPEPQHRRRRPGRSVDDLAGRSATSAGHAEDRKSTRLNSSHRTISYAVFCLKKKKKKKKRKQIKKKKTI